MNKPMYMCTKVHRVTIIINTLTLGIMYIPQFKTGFSHCIFEIKGVWITVQLHYAEDNSIVHIYYNRPLLKAYQVNDVQFTLKDKAVSCFPQLSEHHQSLFRR